MYGLVVFQNSQARLHLLLRRKVSSECSQVVEEEHVVGVFFYLPARFLDKRIGLLFTKDFKFQTKILDRNLNT